ncbi:MAG: glucose-6-phosphate isomerase [Negativicutes bacterium]|nr:glucose-6-phosphate isomerase [Negativicutes bacterium]
MYLNGKIKLTSGFCFDYTNMIGEGLIKEDDIASIQDKIERAVRGLAQIRGNGVSNGHLSKNGEPEPVYFTRLPVVADCNPNTPEAIAALKAYSKQIWDTKEAVIFFGIGGSYLGNRVLFDIHAGSFWNQQKPLERHGYPKVFFSGNNLDSDQYASMLAEIIRQAQYKRFAGQGKTKVMLIPITKSGTTLETIAAFVYFYENLKQEIDLFEVDVTVVTDLDAGDGPLCQLAAKNNWQTFDIKEGVGGRFCVLSNPGLITAAVVGIDIEELLAGAHDMEMACRDEDPLKNPALLNAVLKYLAAESYGCDIEILMPYSMRLKSLGEWYVQLLAESLGKRCDRQGKQVNYGRTPIAAVGTTDMHAQTQQHQDGRRNKVVQFVEILEKNCDVRLGNPFSDVEFFTKFDDLCVDEALQTALAANAQALNEDLRFNANYQLPKLTTYYVGQLLYFLMLSVAYEGELADVDAYDQPGVEAYKKIMKEKLGR